MTDWRSTSFVVQAIRTCRFQIGMLIQINCCGTRMGGSGLEPMIEASSTFIRAKRTFSQRQMDYQGTSFVVFLKTVKAMSGLVQLEESIDFENSLSTRPL